VAFLIFILLGVLLLQHFYILPGYKSSLEKVAISKIETLVDNMDHIIDNLESFAYVFAVDKDLRNKLLSGSAIDIQEGINYLNKRKGEYPILDEIMILYKDSPVFYTSSGVTSRDNMLKFNENIAGWDSFYTDIATDKKISLVAYHRPYLQNQNDLAMIVNITPDGKEESHTKICYLLSYNYVDNFIKNLSLENVEDFCIITGDNAPWINTFQSHDEYLTILEKQKKGFHYTKSRISVVKSSSYSGLTYIHGYSSENFLSSYINFQSKVLMLILALGLIGVIFAFKLSSTNYSVIKRILRPLKKDITTIGKNDLKNIESIISNIINQNDIMSKTLQYQEPLIKERALLYIIEGKYNDNERFKHLITNLNLDLDKKAFALFLIDIESECENPDEIYECITSYIEENRFGYCLEIQKNYNLIVLIADNAIDTISELSNMISEHIMSEISKKFNCKLCKYDGGTCLQISHVHNLYANACAQRNIYKKTTDDSEEKSTDSQKNDEQIFKEVITFVHNNYTDANLSLVMVADQIGKSVYFTSRLFKTSLGCTFSDYVSHLRVEKAKTLLTTTGLTINELTEAVGYIDSSSFNKKFKSIVGCSLGAYRKNHSKNSISHIN
jgi:AraC-like DNA-binding protein